jgi:hypothetical protein
MAEQQSKSVLLALVVNGKYYDMMRTPIDKTAEIRFVIDSDGEPVVRIVRRIPENEAR